MSDADISRLKRELQRADKLNEFVVQEAVKLLDVARDERFLKMLRWVIRRHSDYLCPSDFGETCRETDGHTPAGYQAWRCTQPHVTWAQLTNAQLGRLKPRYGEPHLESTIDLERIVRRHLDAP